MANTEFPDVEIFTTPTCPDCRQLKAWLTFNGVPFTERDLTDPAVAESEFCPSVQTDNEHATGCGEAHSGTN